MSISVFPINPIYILGLILILVGIALVDITKIDKVFLLYFFYFICTLCCFGIGLYFFSKQASNIVYLSSFLYLYCILMGMQTIISAKNLTLYRRQTVYHYSYNFLIIFLILDLISRLINTGSFSINFYNYKHGWFYFDSNFTGLVIALFLMFAVFLKKNKKYYLSQFKFFVLFLLLLSTFSRASIFSFIVSYLVLKYAGRYMVGFASILLILFIYIFYNMVNRYISGESFVEIDGSFNSKFYLINLAIENYDKLDLTSKLFGIGLANFSYYADIFAHNMLVTLVYEFGIIGTSLFLLFLYGMYIRIGKDVLYLYIPLLIGGFSLFSAYMPFFFILLACMYVEVIYDK